MPKPPMTPDDIDALSKAWNESKAATDAVLAKFREGAAMIQRPEFQNHCLDTVETSRERHLL